MRGARNHLRFFALLATIAVASLSGSPALADARTEARRHFRRGMELVVQGQVDAGIAELEEAYAILPHPNVLYNIGRAYAEAGRYDEARDYFDRYLETDPPDREEVRAVMAAIDERLAARQAIQAAAQQAAAQQGAGAPSGGTSGSAGASTDSTVVATASAEQIAELRSTATQFRSIAELSGSQPLRDRADELDRLAAALEAAAAARAAASASADGTTASDGTSGTDATSTQDGGTTTTADATTVGETAPAEAALQVAEASGGSTYEEEVVSSSRFAQSPLDAASATTIITRQDIRLTGITIFPELLRRVAGVHLMAMTPSDVNIGIRGFNRTIAPRVVVLVNGRSTYIDALGVNFPMQQSIDVEDVERIEIIRGPASALYGANAFSGIVNIITRTPGDEPGTEVTIGGGNGAQMRARVATTGRRGDVSYRFSGGYQQSNRWSLPFDPARRQDYSYPIRNPELALREVHGRADVRYRLGRDARLSFEGGGSYTDNLAVWGNAGFTDTNSRGSSLYSMAGLQTGWGSVRAFWNRYDFDITQADQHLPAMRMTGNTIDVEAVFARELDLGVPHNIHLGVGYRWKDIDWTLLDGRYTQNHYAVFFEDTMRISDVVRLTAGFRMDKHPIIDRVIWSPRAALVLRPTEGQSFRISGTSSFRTMSFAETYVRFGLPTPVASAVGGFGVGSEPNRLDFGAPALRPERIVTAEIGYQNQESDYFSLDVSVYFNRVWDFMGIGTSSSLYTLADYANAAIAGYTGFDRTSDRFAAAASVIDNEPNRYNVFGAEIGARFFPVEGLDVYANYSPNYSYVTNPQPGASRREERQPRHMLNTGFQYRAPFRLDVAADLHVYAKTLWPEPVFSESGLELEYLPLPAYFLVNARVGYRFLDDRFEVGVAAYNLTNNRAQQHPFAQTMATRVMASLTARF